MSVLKEEKSEQSGVAERKRVISGEMKMKAGGYGQEKRLVVEQFRGKGNKITILEEEKR